MLGEKRFSFFVSISQD